MRIATITIVALVLAQLNIQAPILEPSRVAKSDTTVANFVSNDVTKRPDFVDRSKEAEIAKQIDIQKEQARLAEIERIKAIETAKQVNIPTPSQTTPKTPVIASDDIYMQLAYCESGARWDYNGSSGYDGAFQFSPSTWSGMGTGYAFAYLAPPDVQIDAAKRLIARSGWGQFPACARKLGML